MTYLKTSYFGTKLFYDLESISAINFKNHIIKADLDSEFMKFNVFPRKVYVYIYILYYESNMPYNLTPSPAC